ncbi:MAG: hypothetical protein K2O45_08475, partial [Oscillospiraceae bacterium]|nr:hypothetical protein [Oscillospiraceae bacterium]
MSDYHSKVMPVNRGITLNSLRDQLYSLNMRLLLAMQYHNEEAQEEIREQMTAVQAEIANMGLGRRTADGEPHHTNTVS